MEQRLKDFAGNLWQTLLSIVKILLKSRKCPSCKQLPDSTDLVVLANGPSLNNTITAHRDFLTGQSLWAVNHAVQSDAFVSLQPQYYLLADPLFWLVPEICNNTFKALAERVTWAMTLFMPTRANSSKEWSMLLAANTHITVVQYNSTPVEGFQWFTNCVYRKGWGMPRPHNVLIASLAVALRMPFKTIYIAGADHSWLPEISVNDNNEVLMHQKHYYDTNTSRPATVRNEDLSTARLHTILGHMATAFRSYWILRDFAQAQHIEVLNITPNSYIDAFPRYSPHGQLPFDSKTIQS